ncbi:FYVE zinc finger-domain-containing protein [Poronia punctata]|nr:FYVE zinc finger-domain-containing protein [Poronia punctata]
MSTTPEGPDAGAVPERASFGFHDQEEAVISSHSDANIGIPAPNTQHLEQGRIVAGDERAPSQRTHTDSTIPSFSDSPTPETLGNVESSECWHDSTHGQPGPASLHPPRLAPRGRPSLQTEAEAAGARYTATQTDPTPGDSVYAAPVARIAQANTQSESGPRRHRNHRSSSHSSSPRRSRSPSVRYRGSELRHTDSPPATRPQNTRLEYSVPRWQPDAEVTNCSICGAGFTLLYRKHHCRKCGRVVCDRCSPHRIIIPRQFVVRPPDYTNAVRHHYFYGNEGGIADFGSIGGGERVRLCNPCVPDPNMTPPAGPSQPRPQPRPQPQPPQLPEYFGPAGFASPAAPPVGIDWRPALRPQRNSVDYSQGHSRRVPSDSYGYSTFLEPRQGPVRNRSATTSAGFGGPYHHHGPYPPRTSHPPFPTLAHFSQSGGHDQHATLIEWFRGATNIRGSQSVETPGSGLDRPLPEPPRPEIAEEDICPVCHCELPSRALVNFEALRESHINDCIASRTGPVASSSTEAGRSIVHGTPPPRTTRRTRMIPYIATEKDGGDNQECIVCLENFAVGDEMARLECFCKFHFHCINSWFVNHPGRCPVHQHDSYGY